LHPATGLIFSNSFSMAFRPVHIELVLKVQPELSGRAKRLGEPQRKANPRH